MIPNGDLLKLGIVHFTGVEHESSSLTVDLTLNVNGISCKGRLHKVGGDGGADSHGHLLGNEDPVDEGQHIDQGHDGASVEGPEKIREQVGDFELEDPVVVIVELPVEHLVDDLLAETRGRDFEARVV